MTDPSTQQYPIRLVQADGSTPIAILENAYEAVLTEQLLDDNGGEETLSFSLPITDPKTGLIHNEMHLRVTYVTNDSADAPFQVTSVDTVHVVRTITEGYDDQSNRIYNVYAEALWYDLTTDDLITVTPAVPDATSAMTAILANTGWSIGVIGVPAPAGDVAWGSADLITPLAALRSLPAIFGGELVFDTVNKQVSLIPRRGDQTPHLLYIREGNMSHDTKTVSTTTLTTRVHPVGANGVDISSLTGNVGYIEDYSYYDTLGLPRSVKAQEITNDQISDPTALLQWAQNQLATMAKPTVTYDIGVSLLAGKAIPHLGDLVRVNDPTLNLDTYARVSRREFNLIKPALTTIIVDTAAYTLATPSGGGTGLATGSTGADFTIPDPPTALLLLFGSGLDPNGNWNTYGVAEWTAPIANTDGTPISDLDHYDIEVLPFGSNWVPVGATGDTQAGFGYIPSGQFVSVRVRAVDHSQNRSTWTLAGTIVPLPTPFYLPPSTPTLDADTLPLCIQVIWNGLDNNHVPYPSDVDTIEVHLVQTGASFTPTAGTLHTAVPAQLGGFTVPLTGLTAGLPYTIELVAVGRLDTRSAASVAVTASVLPVGPTHLVYNGDQDNIIADGSFETPGGQATFMADSSWSSAWSFITAITAPGGRGAAAVAHGQYALMGTGGTTTGVTRSVVLARSAAMTGQKFWLKIKYWNATTGGTCTFAVQSFDADGNPVDNSSVTLPANSGYQTAAFNYVFPTGATTFQVYVTMNAATSAGFLFLDAAECRSVIQTAIIDSLAVTDAQIANLSVSKVTAGVQAADVVIGQWITTATARDGGGLPTGARVDITNTGLYAYNGSGQTTVSITSGGAATFSGTVLGAVFETATSGKRVVIDPGFNASLLRLYTGDAAETSPGQIESYFGPAMRVVGPTSAAHPTACGVGFAPGSVTIFDDSGASVGIGAGHTTITGPAAVTGSLTVGGAPVTTSPDGSGTVVECGVTTVLTDSNGYATVTTDYGGGATAVVANGQYPIGGTTWMPSQVMTDSFASFSFRVRLARWDGAFIPNQNVVISWVLVV